MFSENGKKKQLRSILYKKTVKLQNLLRRTQIADSKRRMDL